MKKSFLLYLIMSVFLIGYCACDNDEENFDTATTGQVIKVPDDIKSFNSVTKEIVFEKNISIKRECEAAAAAGEKDNVVVNAPHTAVEIAGEWPHPYTRQQAVFPLEWVRQAKFFPYVSKIDAGYGDRNLCCRNCE